LEEWKRETKRRGGGKEKGRKILLALRYSTRKEEYFLIRIRKGVFSSKRPNCEKGGKTGGREKGTIGHSVPENTGE